MMAFKSVVIARQLDELRRESAARRLARIPSSLDEPPTPHARRTGRSILDDSAQVLPALRNYPYPIR